MQAGIPKRRPAREGAGQTCPGKEREASNVRALTGMIQLGGGFRCSTSKARWCSDTESRRPTIAEPPQNHDHCLTRGLLVASLISKLSGPLQPGHKDG
jgi:hypothetical protein